MSKVLLVNGSSRQEGNTSVALAEVAAALEGHGIETETVWLGNKPVNDCIACGKCAELGGKCALDNDVVNELIAKAAQADGFVFGTPVYYAHPSGRSCARSIARSTQVARRFAISPAQRWPLRVVAAPRRRSTC